MAITITNKLSSYVPNFFKEFNVDNEDDREYAGEVFEALPWARDLVLDTIDNHGIVFVNDMFDRCTYDAQYDAVGIYLHDLCNQYTAGDSDILGEFVTENIHYAEEAEEDYMAYAM